MALWNCVNQQDAVSFCEKCHSILEPPDRHNLLTCRYCDYSIASTVREHKSTRNLNKNHFKTMMNKQFNKNQVKKQLSSMNDSWIDEELENDKKLRERLKKQILGSGTKKMIKEECLECGASEQAYETRQLRSVDEGQTIFYECLQCGAKTVLHS